MTKELLSCPFCGGAPYFEGDAADWKDESRYVELSLTCCATMTEALGWRRARDMTVEARTAELTDKLATRWNTRYAPDDADAQRLNSQTGGLFRPSGGMTG